MKRGTKPQPIALKKLHGNPDGHALPEGVPDGAGVLWAPPDYFDDEQRAQWDYALENAPLGVLTATDRECLVTFCIAASARAKAARQVNAEGLIVETKNGHSIQHPALNIMNRMALMMLRAGSEMGFSPSARVSLVTAPGDGPPYARYIGGQRAGQRQSTLDTYLDEKPDKLDS